MMTADTQVKQTTYAEVVKQEVKEEKVEIDTQEKVVIDIQEKEKTVEIDLEEKAVEEDGTAEDEPLVAKEEEPVVVKKNVHKQDYEEGMVYLYQINRSPLLPSVDPACLKLETWLRLAAVKYENVDHGMKFKSKKGQLPFVEFDGEEYCDVSSIIKVLNVNLDESLTVQQRSVTGFAVAMLENHFSWVIKAWRSQNPEDMLKAYKIDVQNVTGKTWPSIILNFVYKCHSKKVAKAVVAHGIGVHTPSEIESFGQDDLQVLSDLLGEKDYFFGEAPTSLDVVAFAHLSQLVYMDSEVQCGLRDWLNEKCPNLVALCARLKEKAFPDWEELLTVKVEELETKEEPETKEESESKKEPETKEVPETKEDTEANAEVEKLQLKKENKIKEKKEKEDKKMIEKEEKKKAQDEKKKVQAEKKKEQEDKKKIEKEEKKKAQEEKKKEQEEKKKEHEEKKKEQEDKKKEQEEKKKEDEDKKDEQVDNKEQTKEEIRLDEDKKEDPSNEEEKKDEEKPVDTKENADESVLSQENTHL